MESFFTDHDLINAPPIKRAAYSDRTAWIMAEISRLVYEALPVEITVTSVVDEIKQAIEKGDYEDMLEGLVAKLQQRGETIESNVVDILREANFELIESYAVEGTEAMVAKMQPYQQFSGMLIVAFRGTEKSITDIRTDIKADLMDAPGGGRVHTGFLKAYQNIETPLRQCLQKNAGLPLYITGHSLGGALALIATRYLGFDSVGATYTFGCPRAADDAFYTDIKTPVYRVVNAADGVARLPFGDGFSLFLSTLRLIPINGTFQISEWLRRKYYGYTHQGSLTFLSGAPSTVDENGLEFKDLDVEHSPNFFWRSKEVIGRLISSRGKAAGSDHRITEYSRKLYAYAKRRNPVQGQQPEEPAAVATPTGDKALEDFLNQIPQVRGTREETEKGTEKTE